MEHLKHSFISWTFLSSLLVVVAAVVDTVSSYSSG